MRIALVHDYLNQYGGAERVLEALHALYPDAPVYTAMYAPAVMPPAYRSCFRPPLHLPTGVRTP